MSEIETEGWEELEKSLQEMMLDKSKERAAMKIAMVPVSAKLKSNTPVGLTKKLSKIKIEIKQDVFSTTGIVKSEAFWDIFQNYGTSKQKSNVGYFDKAIDGVEDEAVNILTKTLLK